MVKTAENYPITFPYKANNPVGSGFQYYGPITQTVDYIAEWHEGEDRAMPVGTVVKVGSLKIGTSGNTGASTGPHLHVGKYRLVDGQRTYLNPKGWSSVKGTVVFAGKNGTAGNEVVIKTPLGSYYRFLHLGKIVTSKGKRTY